VAETSATGVSVDPTCYQLHDTPAEGAEGSYDASAGDTTHDDSASEGRTRHEVLQEWSLNPIEKGAATALSSPPLPTHAHHATSASAQVSPVHGRPQRHATLQQRRRERIEDARRSTLTQLSDRHRSAYERDALHAYHLLKRIEGELLHWNQQRRRQRRHGSIASDGDQTEGQASPDNNTTGSVTKTRAGAEHDVDAVDARFFEYSGQIRRTLHQLTPRHFDVMRGYRLHHRSPQRAHARASGHDAHAARDSDASSAASRTPAPPLFSLRLLWRLLHITQLFYAVGRHASLPRSIVHNYVQSASCGYGVRELLRVLGAELALTSVGLSGAASTSASAVTFSKDELFQLFYAALCLPSEDAPGAPAYDPAVLVGRDDARLLFQRDCVATGPVTGRMPLEEWCVRWWCHVYTTHHQTTAAPSSSSPPATHTEAGIDAVLTIGQAMDVIRAALYATTETEGGGAAATLSAFAPTPFTYFETSPRGTAFASSTAGPQDSCHVERRYRPRLIGALGGDRSRLRIPYHLGQRFVQCFLQHLLSAASDTAAASRSTAGSATGKGGGDETPPSSAGVETTLRLLRLLHRRAGEAVNDVALLCTAILFFEVYSPSTAAFMAHAAPLCREQAELLNGHEVSCVLLAYASLQRWERGHMSSDSTGEARLRTDCCRASEAQRAHKGFATSDCSANDARTVYATVNVRSASATAAGAGQPSSTSASCPSFSSTTKTSAASSAASQADSTRGSTTTAKGVASAATEEDASRKPPPPPRGDSSFSWHLFYVTLGSRAGQLGDTLSEEDVTRVLRAMELAGLEHDDLRRALESSLRMRNLGRRMLYET
jgi:hypothetical protein